MTFCELACPAFAAIAGYGLADTDVVRRLAEIVNELGETVASQESRRALVELAESIGNASKQHAPMARDRVNP